MQLRLLWEFIPETWNLWPAAELLTFVQSESASSVAALFEYMCISEAACIYQSQGKECESSTDVSNLTRFKLHLTCACWQLLWGLDLQDGLSADTAVTLWLRHRLFPKTFTSPVETPAVMPGVDSDLLLFSLKYQQSVRKLPQLHTFI